MLKGVTGTVTADKTKKQNVLLLRTLIKRVANQVSPTANGQILFVTVLLLNTRDWQFIHLTFSNFFIQSEGIYIQKFNDNIMS